VTEQRTVVHGIEAVERRGRLRRPRATGRTREPAGELRDAAGAGRELRARRRDRHPAVPALAGAAVDRHPAVLAALVAPSWGKVRELGQVLRARSKRVGCLKWGASRLSRVRLESDRLPNSWASSHEKGGQHRRVPVHSLNGPDTAWRPAADSLEAAQSHHRRDHRSAL
jgi:hypothetical protein